MSQYQLMKISDPGWTITYQTIEKLRQDFEKWICSQCWEGEFEDDDGIDLQYYSNASDVEKIAIMLGTPCGCEHAVDDYLDEQIEQLTNQQEQSE